MCPGDSPEADSGGAGGSETGSDPHRGIYSPPLQLPEPADQWSLRRLVPTRWPTQGLLLAVVHLSCWLLECYLLSSEDVLFIRIPAFAQLWLDD